MNCNRSRRFAGNCDDSPPIHEFASLDCRRPLISWGNCYEIGAENFEVLLLRSVAVAVMKLYPAGGRVPKNVNVAIPAAFVTTVIVPTNSRPDEPLLVLAKTSTKNTLFGLLVNVPVTLIRPDCKLTETRAGAA